MPGATAPSPSQPTSTTKPATAASFQIKSLGFGGSGQSTISRDNGNGTYDETSQWLDGNLNGKIDGAKNKAGTIDGATEHDYPLSYVRSMPNTPDNMQVTVTLAGALTPGEQIEGLTNYNGINFSPVTIAAGNVNNGVTTVTLTASAPLPSTIDSNDLGITWEYSLNNGASFTGGENTSNHLYVTGAAASAAYETELWLVCNAAKGLAVDPTNGFATAQVAEAVWARFAHPIPGMQRVDGTIMRYWGSVVNSPVYTDADNNVAGLMKYADGKCNAWADFLVAAWAVAGVQSHVWGITPSPSAYTPPAGYTLAGFAIKYWLPAQGNAAPNWAFTDHAVVEIDGVGTVFDPSYGAVFDNSQAWMDGSVDKFEFNNGTLNWTAPHQAGKADCIFAQQS